MNAHDVIRNGMQLSDMIWKMYVQDLTPAEMLRRPCPGANHVTWQLGHLIASERSLLEAVCPGEMPALPTGFAERYTKETSTSDDPAAFDSKEALLAAFETQRAGTLAALAKLSAADLDGPIPEHLRKLGGTVGALIAMQSGHYLMHAGQWAVLRRMLGRPAMF